MVIHIYKFTGGCHIQTTPSSEQRQPWPRNVFSTLFWQANPQLGHRVIKPPSLPINHKAEEIELYQDEMGSHIYKFTGRSHSQTTPSSDRDSQGQQTVLAPFPDRQTCNYDIECSNYHLSLSTMRSKGLSRSKMKWPAIYINIQVYAIAKLPHPWSGDSQGQETFLAPSADSQTNNYDIECSNLHLSLSTIGPKALSRSKMKWPAIYINLPMDATVWLRPPRSADSQGQETFLAPSADKQIHN